MNVAELPNMSKRLIKRGVRLFGASLVSFSLAVFIYSLTPLFLSFVYGEVKGEKEDSPAPLNVVKPGIKVAEEAYYSYGVDSAFAVVIPSIKAYSDIIPNVDPFNRAEYSEALEKGVAHAKGSSFPGQGKTTYLFAHSTDTPTNIARFNAIFYSLKDLKEGDSIIVYYKHKKYVYKVSEKQTVSSKDTSWLEDKGGELLVLQTCYPPGTTWKRLLIIARPI